YHDGTLTFRRSCAHGVCGSDAMVINGENALACVLLIREAGRDITIEPIRGLPVIKDLVIDMEPFFEQYRSVMQYLVNTDDPGYTERLQSAEDRARFDDTTKCILCAACTTSCPIYWGNESYVGPAAIVNAHRFIFDSRDQAAGERLEILNQPSGVFRCRTAFPRRVGGRRPPGRGHQHRPDPRADGWGGRRRRRCRPGEHGRGTCAGPVAAAPARRSVTGARPGQRCDPPRACRAGRARAQ